ncbi:MULTISPECIES: hypothetical protein [unclassified Caballeronia]|uniref:hypothetical protein n=1 Tax=unclassified Caballeronia TaxID=2646786 RepID=UPI00202942FE|nr:MULTISPECIES: hypothetical protein [unclassified Caballeronia]
MFSLVLAITAERVPARKADVVIENVFIDRLPNRYAGRTARSRTKKRADNSACDAADKHPGGTAERAENSARFRARHDGGRTTRSPSDDANRAAGLLRIISGIDVSRLAFWTLRHLQYSF